MLHSSISYTTRFLHQFTGWVDSFLKSELDFTEYMEYVWWTQTLFILASDYNSSIWRIWSVFDIFFVAIARLHLTILTFLLKIAKSQFWLINSQLCFYLSQFWEKTSDLWVLELWDKSSELRVNISKSGHFSFVWKRKKSYNCEK